MIPLHLFWLKRMILNTFVCGFHALIICNLQFILKYQFLNITRPQLQRQLIHHWGKKNPLPMTMNNKPHHMTPLNHRTCNQPHLCLITHTPINKSRITVALNMFWRLCYCKFVYSAVPGYVLWLFEPILISKDSCHFAENSSVLCI